MHVDVEDDVVCPFCQAELASDQNLVTCYSCHQATNKICFLGFLSHIKPASNSIRCPLCRKNMSTWSSFRQFSADNCNICQRKVMENSIGLKCGAPIHFLCFLAWVDEDINPESLKCRGCENVDTWQLYKQLVDKYILDPNFNCGRCMKGFVDGDLMFNIIDCDHNVCDECLLITLASNRCSRCGVRIDDLPPWPYRFIEVNSGVLFVPLNADYEKIS